MPKICVTGGLLWLAAVFAPGAEVGGGGVVEEFDVAGVKIRIPAPVGYLRINGKNVDFDKVTMSSLAPGTVLMGFYGTEEDLKGLEGGEFPKQERNYSAQVLEAERSVTGAQFEEVLAATEGQMTESMEEFEKLLREAAGKAGKTAGEIAGSDVVFELGKMVPLGVMGKGEGWLTFGMRLSLDAKRAEGEAKVNSTVVATLMRVGAKVVALYVTDLTGKGSVEDGLKEEAWKWRRAVAEANREGGEKGG